VKVLFYISIIGLLFFGCKKYSEDPFFSLRKPEKRILGDWELKSYKIDGIDYLSVFTPPDSFYTKGYIKKTSLPIYIKFFVTDGERLYNTYELGRGSWSMEAKENYSYLNIKASAFPYGNPPNIMPVWPLLFCHTPPSFNSNSIKSQWLIKRLYKNKMHLVQYINNTKYELEFIKY